MKRFSTLLTAGALALISILSLVSFTPSFALTSDLSIQSGAEASRGTDQPADIFGASGAFTTVTNVLLFVIGAVSVIMLIIGGLRYVISGGNSSAVTAAKNTILYAIIGIIVALLAYAIIHFVINSFAAGSSGGATNV